MICDMYNSQTVYHVYNQSNNYEPLYRTDANYRFFLRKVRKHLVPYAEVLCYCLMPDHFHFMLMPTELGCLPSRSGRYLRMDEEASVPQYQQNLSHAIKTLLSSYTQAMNKRYHRRGSLFRAKTKAKPGYIGFCPDDVQLAEGQSLADHIPYLRVCFDYIHNNPVKAGYVVHPEEWEHSSALAYTGWPLSSVCNFELVEQLLGITKPYHYRRPTGDGVGGGLEAIRR